MLERPGILSLSPGYPVAVGLSASGPRADSEVRPGRWRGKSRPMS